MNFRFAAAQNFLAGVGMDWGMDWGNVRVQFAQPEQNFARRRCASAQRGVTKCGRDSDACTDEPVRGRPSSADCAQVTSSANGQHYDSPSK